ncbi:PhzF family phenazine biosynthesis protein [Companilactobacillus nodensis]|uniref:Phenazine biosynthesis protein PhzF n=1 Tax=Companilactobacillus nodensis DSM 19682 = JCM 14932 = NBRC 107160 TaxID=1423775 RepID=A0A0R1K9I3_9LACO|nr:PhzF family phenazine biosynthesis protein [Companilactobacillus nodensis]KRK80160.1 phenazine biosynthesis protein PhzF [Companilactobacillus nodensis DSM 19682 = JCM 14932 = NBRC 107160]
MKSYTVDAFTNEIFKGNPAAVLVMDHWLPDETLQNIAIENGVAETAFTVKEGDSYKLRWFTHKCELELCGHATLATAFILMKYYEPEIDSVTFQTLGGEVKVTKIADRYELEFPSFELKQVEVTKKMEDSIGAKIQEAYLGRDLLCVVDSPETVINLQPDFDKIAALDGVLLNVTAMGKEYDCVSRTFTPKHGVLEDQVCGSGHCHIVPYWSKRLGKKNITAFQASQRTGVLYGRYEGAKTYLAGNAVLYSTSEINL